MAHPKLKPCPSGSTFAFWNHTYALSTQTSSLGSVHTMVPVLGVTEAWGHTHQLPAKTYQPQKAIPKPFPLFPPPPTNALVPLQGNKLAEKSPSAGWGLGQRCGWAWARARRGSQGQGEPPSSLTVAASISSTAMSNVWTSGCPEGSEGEGHPPGTRKSMTALEHMWRFPSRFAALRKGKFWGTEPWLGTLFMLPWSDAHWFRNLLKATCKIKAFLCSLFGPKTVSFSKMLHISAAFANGRNDASLLKH